MGWGVGEILEGEAEGGGDEEGGCNDGEEWIWSVGVVEEAGCFGSGVG